MERLLFLTPCFGRGIFFLRGTRSLPSGGSYPLRRGTRAYFCATKVPKTWGTPNSPTPPKRPFHGDHFVETIAWSTGTGRGTENGGGLLGATRPPAPHIGASYRIMGMRRTRDGGRRTRPRRHPERSKGSCVNHNEQTLLFTHDGRVWCAGIS